MNTPLVECYALHTKFLTGSPVDFHLVGGFLLTACARLNVADFLLDPLSRVSLAIRATQQSLQRLNDRPFVVGAFDDHVVLPTPMLCKPQEG
jgi:hypothetical protein